MATLLDYALTTVSDVKETLGIASSNTTKDNLITRKINQATEMIEGYCDRRFKEQTNITEYYDGSSIDQLILRNRPITNTTTLAISGRDTTLNDDDFSSLDSDYFFADNNAGVIDGIASFSGRYDRWKVVYSAGYATIPADLAEACASLAAYLVTNDPSSTAGITQKKEGTREIHYSNNKNGYDGNNLIEQLGLQVTLDRYSSPTISGLR